MRLITKTSAGKKVNRGLVHDMAEVAEKLRDVDVRFYVCKKNGNVRVSGIKTDTGWRIVR